MTKAHWHVHTNPKDASVEGAYNEWYDNTHLTELLAVPGIVAAKRFELVDPTDGALRYLTIYDIDADDPKAVIEEVMTQATAGKISVTDTLELENPAPATQLYLEH